MDVNQLCGLLSITSESPVVCSIPTTYFTQGIHGFAENTTSVINEDNADLSDDDDEEEDDQNSNNCECNDDQCEKSEYKRTRTRIRYLREEYNCVSCKYTCTTEKAYVRHALKCDGNEDKEIKLSCSVCGKDYRNDGLLDVHMRNHRNGKHFCCDLCKYKSLQLKKLIQHRRMHTGEKPHLCPFCDYRSSRRDNLKSHVKRVHKKELTGDTFVPRNIIMRPRDNDL